MAINEIIPTTTNRREEQRTDPRRSKNEPGRQHPKSEGDPLLDATPWYHYPAPDPFLKQQQS